MRNKIFLSKQKKASSQKRTRYSGLFSISLVLILMTLFTWQCKEDDFTGEVKGICPEVVTTDPVNGATNVGLNKIITATFNEEMDPASINESTFLLKKGTTAVAGAVTYSGLTATFTPANLLSGNTLYTATITRGAKDLMGNVMRKDTTWKFTTGPIVLPVLPVVLLTDPNNNAVNVAIDKVIKATFSKTMDLSTINSSTFMLKNGSSPVLGFVNYAGVDGTFTPNSPLLPGTLYTATITTGAKDLEGNALAANYVWTFTTSTALGQFTIGLSSNPSVGGSTNGGGIFSSGAWVTAIAIPNAGFSFLNWTEGGVSVSPFSSYTFVANNNRILVANFTAITAGPGGIDLGSAGNFAILAGAGVSNTGVTTIITGDVGSFPTGTINGLLSGNVIGTLYTVASPVVGTAKTDLTTAFNDAQSRSVNAISLPGQLGGLTLAPG